MTLFRKVLFFSPIVCLLAQTPPPASPPKPAPATQPTVTMSMENPNAKLMPVVPPDRVVITVGESTLTAAQLDQIIDSLPEQYRASARGAGRKQFADNIVRILVLSQEGKRRKISESPSYQTQVAFQNANLLAGLTYVQIGKEVPLDEAAVRKYYDDHKQEFEQVHARHILVRMQGSPQPVKPGQKELTEAEALAKATELRTKIEGGADFAALASAESDDSQSAVKGGDLGFFRHGQMVPSFDQAAFAMKPGEISAPVKSQFGFHIIQVEAHDVKSFEEVKPDIEKRLRPEQAQKALEDLQKKAHVVLDPEFFGLAKQ
jgi:peptidyl-prolyl cis-trans isomerase C